MLGDWVGGGAMASHQTEQGRTTEQAGGARGFKGMWSLSEVFALWLVLAAFFSRCGTLGRKGWEMAANRMVAGNQWVEKGRFDRDG